MDAVGDHLFSQEYDRNYKDIFIVQSEVAQTIANEIEVAITPKEKELIEKIPTTDLTAHDYYQRGKDEYGKYKSDRNNREALNRAEELYHKALEYDSTFALSYVGLANVYWNKQYYEDFFSESFLDSCIVLINKALSFDDQLDEAYLLKGEYYQETGQLNEALFQYDRAIKINPNYFRAYHKKGIVLTMFEHDFVKGIDNYNKALNLIRGDEYAILLRQIGLSYLNVGFTEKAEKYYKEAYALDSNKAMYLSNLSFLEFSLENFEEALILQKQTHEIDSIGLQQMMIYNVASGHKEEAYELAQKYVEFYELSGALALQDAFQIGYAFWQVGKYKEAEDYFMQQIEIGEASIKLNRNIAQWGAAHHDLASTYAFLGDKVKAYQYLDELNELNFFPLYWVSYAKHNPLINSIRNEERYQKFLENMEAKHQAEHERVRMWLEENDML